MHVAASGKDVKPVGQGEGAMVLKGQKNPEAHWEQIVMEVDGFVG